MRDKYFFSILIVLFISMAALESFETLHQSNCKRHIIAPTKKIVHVTNEKNIGVMPCASCGKPSVLLIYDFKDYDAHAGKPEMSAPLMSLCHACAEQKIERCTKHDMVMMELYNYFHWKE